MLGQEIEMLLPERFKHQHAAYRTDYFDQPKVRPMSAALELYGRAKRWHRSFRSKISLSPLQTERRVAPF